MLSKELEFTLNRAFKQAREKRHEYMTVEHMLLALLDNPAAAKVLRACGADPERLRRELNAFIEETTPLLPADEERDTQPTLGFQRVLQRAVFHVQSAGRRRSRAPTSWWRCSASRTPRRSICSTSRTSRRLDVVNYISHGISKVPGEDPRPGSGSAAGSAEEGGKRAAARWRASPPT